MRGIQKACFFFSYSFQLPSAKGKNWVHSFLRVSRWKSSEVFAGVNVPLCIYSPLQYSVPYHTGPNRIDILDDYCLTEILLKIYSKIEQYMCLQVQRIFSIVKKVPPQTQTSWRMVFMWSNYLLV